MAWVALFRYRSVVPGALRRGFGPGAPALRPPRPLCADVWARASRGGGHRRGPRRAARPRPLGFRLARATRRLEFAPRWRRQRCRRRDVRRLGGGATGRDAHAPSLYVGGHFRGGAVRNADCQIRARSRVLLLFPWVFPVDYELGSLPLGRVPVPGAGPEVIARGAQARGGTLPPPLGCSTLSSSPQEKIDSQLPDGPGIGPSRRAWHVRTWRPGPKLPVLAVPVPPGAGGTRPQVFRTSRAPSHFRVRVASSCAALAPSCPAGLHWRRFRGGRGCRRRQGAGKCACGTLGGLT